MPGPRRALCRSAPVPKKRTRRAPTCRKFRRFRPTLHHQRRRHCRIADDIPRKPGETKARANSASPNAADKRGDAAKAIRPEQPGGRGGHAVKQQRARQAIRGRQAATPRQSCPLRQKGVAQATRGPQQNSRNRTTSLSKSRAQPAQRTCLGRTAGAIEQPDQNRKGDEQNRKEIERRQGQNRRAPASIDSKIRLPPQHSMIFSAIRSKPCPLRANCPPGSGGPRPIANQMPHSFKKPVRCPVFAAAFLQVPNHCACRMRWNADQQYARWAAGEAGLRLEKTRR
jgi:hypothetical protein